MLLQVGETGRTVGVEHIPELVDRSIKAIKKTPAAYLMDGGNLVVHCTHFSLSHISLHSLLPMPLPQSPLQLTQTYSTINLRTILLVCSTYNAPAKP